MRVNVIIAGRGSDLRRRPAGDAAVFRCFADNRQGRGLGMRVTGASNRGELPIWNVVFVSA